MNKYNLLAIFLLLVCITFSCSDDPVMDTPEEEIVQDTTAYNLTYGALPSPDLPADNTLTEQGVQLGRMLFYEKLLSKDGSQSCASCHRQEHAFTDTTRFSLGVEARNG